jgi:ABC-2 type transport system permease protein
MKRLLVLTKAMLLMHLRDRLTLFWNTVFPAFLLVIFGLAFGTTRVGSRPYTTWVLPGLVVLNIMAFGLIRSSALMLELRQRGVLRRLQATPVPALHLVGSYVVVNLLVCLVQSAMLVLLAVLLYDVPITVQGMLRAMPMVLAGVLTFVALGQLISSGLASTSTAVAGGQLFYYSQMFVTDLFMPLGSMPDWLQKVGPYLPSYALVQAVRPPLLEQAWSPELFSHLLVIAIYGVAAALLAAQRFRWEPRQ